MPLDVDNAKGELVIDPHHYKERYLAWDKRIRGISPENEAIVVRYLDDMHSGINVNPKAVKGKRSYARLISQRHRMKKICQLLEQHKQIDNIACATQEDFTHLESAIADIFRRMEDDQITRKSGKLSSIV